MQYSQVLRNIHTSLRSVHSKLLRQNRYVDGQKWVCMGAHSACNTQRSGAQPHADLNVNFNQSTSAKPVMTQLQNSLVALVNMDIFQMTLKFSSLTVH